MVMMSTKNETDIWQAEARLDAQPIEYKTNFSAKYDVRVEAL